jgi:sarcosine oxidase, subunit beta
MKVVVIGGGLMGTASAYYLARRGIKVTLIDRMKVGQGATVASFGNIRRQGRYLPQLPLAHRSRALWGRLADDLGVDVEFRATGHLRLIFDNAGLADMRAFAEAARPWGLDIAELTPAEIARRFPGLGPDAIAASLSPEDGAANPRLIAPAFAAAAARRGAEIFEETTIREIIQGPEGFNILTSRGIIGGDLLLNTAGAWGGRIAERFHEPVPIAGFGPQMGVTEPLPHRILPVVGIWAREKAENVYFRQVERGNVVFGGGARVKVDLDPGHAKVDPALTRAQIPALLRLCPALASASIIRSWSGCEGYIADMLPVMGASGTTPGLFHAFGFCGHGFQLGPGVGDAMAELIATGGCETPLAPFAITRFAA